MAKRKNVIKEAIKKAVISFKNPNYRQKIKYFNFFRTLTAILIALVITFVILLFVSKEPFSAITALLFSPFKSKFWIGEILRASVPLVFAGVAASIMLKCGQFNMIGEGSFYLGGFVAALIAIYLPVSSFLAIVIACLAAIVVTIIFGFIPAILKAKLNVNEFVVSLMLNFIMLWVGMFFLQNYFRDEASGDIATRLIPDENRLGILLKGTYLSTGILIALVVVILSAIFLYKTKYGYTIRITGNNKNFAKFSGLSAMSAIIYSQVIGSAIAGLGGAVEILGGIDGRFSWKALPGYGFDGFIVAILASNNPLLTPLAALFLAYLRTGATLMSLQTDVASELIQIIQAIIIIIVAGQAFMARYKNKIFKNAEETVLKSSSEGQ
ncbi:MAG TPA: ABC transporter permease [Bacilli bacterium]|jgi:simple sugar transport system permease protein|nr:ABC transporter permease [Bacilli bacterium]HOD61568.1 ABC transporter permease [Bacilli bacterium]HOH61829.1 ABC transporter permease [Bacilli bacterium]HPB49067.1 ABC transporter permease [Bacilli bacterium]HPM15226.1 ABC transporter permease [Bacilli bacterium]